MRSLDQFKSSLGSSASSGAAKSFQISSRQPSYSNSSGSFANLKLVAEKLVKEQASSKTDLEVPGDSPKWVRHCTNEDYVAMASQNGLVILSSCEIIRALGRNTRGAVAMRLKEGDRMACVDIIPAAKQDGIESVPGAHHGHKPHGPWLLFVSKNGFGKRVPLSRFRQSPLNRVGLIGYKFSSEDCLAAVFVVGFTTADDGESDKQVVLVSQSGTVNRIKVRDIPIQSRYARLKRLNVGWSEKQRYIKQKLDMIVPLYFGYVLFVIVI